MGCDAETAVTVTTLPVSNDGSIGRRRGWEAAAAGPALAGLVAVGAEIVPKATRTISSSNFGRQYYLVSLCSLCSFVFCLRMSLIKSCLVQGTRCLPSCGHFQLGGHGQCNTWSMVASFRRVSAFALAISPARCCTLPQRSPPSPSIGTHCDVGKWEKMPGCRVYKQAQRQYRLRQRHVR